MNSKLLAAILILGAVSGAYSDQNNQTEETLSCKSPEHRQFDFWIGDWDVTYRTDGKKAGSSRIESILDGCVILENWTGVDGYTGKSFNLYDRKTKKWNQRWVDSRGQLLEFQGEFRKPKMELRGKERSSNGETVQLRMIFVQLEDGKVQQLWEQSKDDGKSWLNLFDGIYSKKN